MNHLRALATAAVAACFTLAACGGGDDDDNNTDGHANDYIAGVTATVDDGTLSLRRVQPLYSNGVWSKRLIGAIPHAEVQVTAVYHNGSPPAATGGLDAEGSQESTAFVGQPFRYQVEANGAFSEVYITVDGTDGYWQLTLPSGVSQLELAITLANTPPSAQWNIQTLLGYSGGVSQPLVLHVEPGDLSESDIAVVLKWTGASDVDLEVVDPKGQRVFYGTPSTPEGGNLDLDSNPDCDIDNVNQEIISWPGGTAPDGEYNVYVNYYNSCGISSSPYTVNITRTGHGAATPVTGTLDGTGSNALEQHLVSTFTMP